MQSVLRLTMVFTIALCAFGALTAISSYFNAAQSGSWPSTKGVVVDSDIVEILNAGDSLTGGYAAYRAYVKYRFMVDARQVESSTISFPNPPNFVDEQSAAEYLRRYPAGREVVVYYRPDDPGESCLERGGGSLSAVIGTTLLFVVIVGFCIFGLSHTSARATGPD